MWARLDANGHVQEVTDTSPVGRFHPSLQWSIVPTGTIPGDMVSGGAVRRAAPSPMPVTTTHFVSLALLRDRVVAAGEWPAVAAAFDALPPEKRWALLAARNGVASDDADVKALLTAVRCDPAVILAAPGPEG